MMRGLIFVSEKGGCVSMTFYGGQLQKLQKQIVPRFPP